MTSEVALHEAGHVLVGLNTRRKLLRVWVRGGEGCVDFEPFRWFYEWDLRARDREKQHLRMENVRVLEVVEQ